MLIIQVCDGYDVLGAYDVVLHFDKLPEQQMIDDTVKRLVADKEAQDAAEAAQQVLEQERNEILTAVDDIIQANEVKEALVAEVITLNDKRIECKDDLSKIGIIVDTKPIEIPIEIPIVRTK